MAALSPSQVSWSAWGSAHQRIPLSSASKAMPLIGELALGVLVPVELGRIREVGAEFEKERPEVLVHAVEVVVVYHGRGVHNPRIGRPGLRPAPPRGAHHAGLLLRAADVEHAFAAAEAREILLRDVVLALALAEMLQLQPLLLDELRDPRNERLRHRCHRRRRGEALAAVLPQVPHHASHVLQPGDVDVEVYPVDGLGLPRDVGPQDVANTPW